MYISIQPSGCREVETEKEREREGFEMRNARYVHVDTNKSC